MITKTPITFHKDTTSALELIPLAEGNILLDSSKKIIFVDETNEQGELERNPYGLNQSAINIPANDTYGVIGMAGETVTIQQLLDYLIDKVRNL